MAERWCPVCRGEFRAGITRCADCDIDLVDRLDAPPASIRSPMEPLVRFGPDERVVELVRLPVVEADLVAAQLVDAGIRAAVFKVGTAGDLAALQYSEGCRVMVTEADLERAAAYVDAID